MQSESSFAPLPPPSSLMPVRYQRASYSLISLFSIVATCLTTAAGLVIALRWSDVSNTFNVSDAYHIAVVVLLGIVFVLTAVSNIALMSSSSDDMTAGKRKHWIHGIFIASLLLSIPAAGICTYCVVQYSQDFVPYNAMTAATAIIWLLVVDFIVLIVLSCVLTDHVSITAPKKWCCQSN